jgi:cation transport ATPase
MPGLRPVHAGHGGCGWVLSGDPVRALACWSSRHRARSCWRTDRDRGWNLTRGAARRDRQGGGPLETLARARVVLFDKTGTLTAGRPRLATVDVGPATDPGAIDQGAALRLAASVEQLSPHVLAGSIVQGARERGLELSMPGDVVETPGAGVSRLVDGTWVAVGTAEFCAGEGGLPRWARDTRRRAAIEGSTCAFIRVDDVVRGDLILDDPLRSETPRAIRSLRRIGFSRIVAVRRHCGGRRHHRVGIGVDAMLANRVPAEKVDAIRVERSTASGRS